MSYTDIETGEISKMSPAMLDEVVNVVKCGSLMNL